MSILAKTLAAIAGGALLATSALAQSAASLLPRGEHKMLIEVVDPEGGVLTARTVTFESPGK